MSLSPFLYLSPTSRFFERAPLTEFQPLDYVELVASLLPTWSITVGFPWTNTHSPETVVNRQGWKIHISATPETGTSILSRIVPLLASSYTTFKFITSSRVLRVATPKNWDRKAAGKFITIYPHDQQQCATLLAQLAGVTEGMTGPYLLTDRPYRDSQVVFYRYGVHRGYPVINDGGGRELHLQDPNGNLVVDQRVPYFSPPAWVEDPFAADVEVEEVEGDILLNDGRFRVAGALRYSSFGGLYRATDALTNKEVVIREVRPHAIVAAQRLSFEALLLKRLGPYQRAPDFIDLFMEEKHSYLVQSYLDTVTLWGHAASFIATYQGRRTAEELRDLVIGTFVEICEGVRDVHELGIVLRDLTKTNVLFNASGRCFFVDFELAFDLHDGEKWIPGGTAGYTSPNQGRNNRPTLKDDCYALGAILLEMLAFTAPALGLARKAALDACKITLEECGLPSMFQEIIEALTDPHEEKRPEIAEVLAELDGLRSCPVSSPTDPVLTGALTPPMPRDTEFELLEKAHTMVDGIRLHIIRQTDWIRSDRLWPGSAELFETNPVSIRFGASGIAHFLSCTGGLGELDPKTWKWIADRADLSSCPRGFYTGLSGIAWIFYLNGHDQESRHLLNSVLDEAKTLDTPGIHDGLAGVGLVALAIGKLGNTPSLVEEAVTIGYQLLRSSLVDSVANQRWWTLGGRIPVGFGAGSCGIALFFLYLHHITSNVTFLQSAKQALNFEVSQLVAIGDQLHLPEFVDDAARQVSPHVRYGTCGLISVLLRYKQFAPEDHCFDSIVERSLLTAASRQTNKLWQDWGLAGFGETLIDAFKFTGKDIYYHASLHTANKLMAFACEDDGGIAFLGNELLRYNTDVGLGSAGIGMFLDRLGNTSKTRLGFFDELWTVDRVVNQE